MSRLPADFVLLQVLPALETGGVEQTTLDVAAAVVGAGGRALVASAGGRLEAELAARGGEAIRLPLASKNPLTMAMNAVRLHALIRLEGVSLVHARSRAPAFSAIAAARWAKVPVVTTYHGVYSGGWPLKRWYNGVMTRGDLTIANSAFTRDHLIGEHRVDPASVVTIPRGVDLARFDPAAVSAERVTRLRAAWGIEADERRLVLLLAGRLTRWKGQGLMIQALGALKARTGRKDLLLVIAGDDQGRADYRHELDALIAEQGLEDGVRIVGHVSDMPAAYLAADAALAPSFPKPEAFGRTAVEPQAMGRPVLASDHGAVKETIVQGETGWRVAPGDLDAWVEALGTLLAATPARRAAMGRAGQDRVRAFYSVQRMTDLTLDAYRGLPAARARILVIKFGALGDFAQVFAPMQAIRRAHPEAHLTLLTTPPYAALAAASSLFDRIETDGRPQGWAAWLTMARRLRRARYDRVYDLHTSKGSTRLWWAMLPRPPEWSGIARFGSHPQTRPDRDHMHNLDRMADQLHAAGSGPAYAAGEAPAGDLSFAVAASLARAKAQGFQSVGSRFGLTPPFALLVPGASATRPQKLWPVERYAALAAALAGRGVATAILGGPDQAGLAARIRGDAPGAVDLTGAGVDQLDFAGLGAEALLCVGNDTGPVHMAAYAGAPGVMLLSTRVSNPAQVGPRAAMEQIFAADLADVAVAPVLAALEPLLPPIS